YYRVEILRASPNAENNNSAGVVLRRSKQSRQDQGTIDLLKTVHDELTGFKKKFRLFTSSVYAREIQNPILTSSIDFDAEFLSGNWQDFENDLPVSLRLTRSGLDAWKKDELFFLQPVIDEVAAAIQDAGGSRVRMGQVKISQ